MNPQQIIELAQQQGATHAEVYQVESLGKPVFFEANRLKQLETSQASGCALRLWRDNCPGLAVAYGPVDPKSLVTKALALTEVNSPEPIEIAPAATFTFPDKGVTLPVETLVEAGKQAIAQIRDIYPEVLCSGEFDCETETTTLVNSQGLHCQYTETSISYYLGLEWIRGEDFLAIYDGELTLDSLDTTNIIKSLIQRLDWAKNNVAPPKGKVPILFTTNAVTMLWSTLSAALNGKRVLEASSPWSEKKGEVVISDKLTLSQQPHLEPYSAHIDDEGTPTQTLSLITKGKLEQFYCDRQTARFGRDRATGDKLNTQTTGNGFRPGLGRYPTPELVNLIIEPGSGTLYDLIATLDDAIVIDQMLGGGADISGDFSVNIDLGYKVEKGQIVGRVKDTMVAGNVYTALKQVIALGGDRTWNGSCHTPAMIVEGLSVVG